MPLSDEVRFLEEEVRAFEEMYRKEIEHGLRFYGADIVLQPLTRYDFASDLIYHFYPMKMLESRQREIGLILPFRRLIFHNLGQGFAPNNLTALSQFSDNNGYGLEYYEFAWQHEPVIEKLKSGDLPVVALNKDKTASWAK